MFENIGGGELLVVVFLIFLFFGPNKIPEISKNLGKGLREIKKAMNSVMNDIENASKP